MRYAVIDLTGDLAPVTGLSIAEAFVVMLTSAGYDFAFARYAGAMHLNTRPSRLDGRHLLSVNPCDGDARLDLMLEAVGLIWGTFRVLREDEFIAWQSRRMVPAPEFARRTMSTSNNIRLRNVEAHMVSP